MSVVTAPRPSSSHYRLLSGISSPGKMAITSAAAVIFSFKNFLMSTAVLAAAVMLKFYFPVILEFAVYELPSVYNAVISWLRPPYLYLVFNCIIITIVASSKLQWTMDDLPAPPPQPVPTMVAVPLPPQPVMEVKITQTDYQVPDSSDLDSSGYDFKVEKGSDCDGYEAEEEALLRTKFAQTDSSADAAVDGGIVLDEDVSSNKENEYVNNKSSLRSTEIINNSTVEQSFSHSKPPLSARFAHRRTVKSSPEGGSKAAALGVSRPKRNETLESTWKTITEGHSVPLTRRYLRKSDTWERDSHSHSDSGARAPAKMMRKSETFQERAAAAAAASGPVVGDGSSSNNKGGMKREASLSEEELNKRVEAFINKFNQEMRLQRQESLNQYMEMVNRGSH